MLGGTSFGRIQKIIIHEHPSSGLYDYKGRSVSHQHSLLKIETTMKLRRNLFGPVLSRWKKQQHERRAESQSTHLQSTNEVCAADQLLNVEYDQRDAVKEKEARIELRKISAKEHQLRKYRINSAKSRPVDIDDYIDDDEQQEEEEGQDEVPQKQRRIRNRTDSIHSRRSTTPSESNMESKPSKGEIMTSQPGSRFRSDVPEERDMPEDDDEEISFRGGHLSKDPGASTIAEYGKLSQVERLPEDEAPTKVTRNAKKHRTKAKLVKYMSHREGSEKGFEVLLEDYRRFVTYCTVEKDADHHGTRTKPTTVRTKSEIESKLSECEVYDSMKEKATDDDTRSNYIMPANSKRRVVRCQSSTCLANVTEDDSNSAKSIQSAVSNKDGSCIDAVSIASAPYRVTSVASCSKSESKCVCKCCGHLLEDSEIITTQNCSTEGSAGLKADIIVRSRSETTRNSPVASECKRKPAQNLVENGSRSDDQTTMPPLIVSLEDSPCSLPNFTPVASTRPSETVPETPMNMLFSIFSSLSTKNNSNNITDLVEMRENDEALHDNHRVGGDEAKRTDTVEVPGGAATRREDKEVFYPLVVTVDSNGSVLTDSPNASTKPSSETVLKSPMDMLFGIFTSLSTKNNSDNKHDYIDVEENGKTRQDKDDEIQDEITRNGEIERTRESTTSTGDKTVIRQIPSHARPPLPCFSKKPASRYVTYPIQRMDSHSSLRSAPPRLSSDFPRRDSKGKMSKQLLSPSSISQRKENGWDGRQ